MIGRAKQLLKEQNIKDDFKKLNEANKYTKDYIYQQLAVKYFLEATTIERICWGEYDARRIRRASAAPPSRRHALAA